MKRGTSPTGFAYKLLKDKNAFDTNITEKNKNSY